MSRPVARRRVTSTRHRPTVRPVRSASTARVAGPSARMDRTSGFDWDDPAASASSTGDLAPASVAELAARAVALAGGTERVPPPGDALRWLEELRHAFIVPSQHLHV